MTEELVGAIRNALERGYSLDEAVQSLINAGYSSIEVNEVAKLFTQPATSFSSSNKPQISQPKPVQKPQTSVPIPKSASQITPQTTQLVKNTPAPQQAPQIINKQIQAVYPQITPIPVQQSMQVPIPAEKKETKQTIAILLVILVLILGIIMLLLMFKDELLNLVT